MTNGTPVPRRDAAPTPLRAPAQQALPLSAVEPPRRPVTPGRTAGSEALWLCLYLPTLPLEAAEAAGETPRYAVYEEVRGVREILQASAAAREAGIRAGLSVNAALALEPELGLAGRDLRRERQALAALGSFAERYTSFVTLEPPDVLLLEIAASLKLFDGLKALRARILRELAALDHCAWPAIAPTPLAATWLARAGTRACIVSPARLPDVLGRLPLGCLAWPDKLVAALAGMGIGRVGDLLRLPRDGFAKRFGGTRLVALDRALGRLPDPRAHYRAPLPFCEDIDLDGEQDDSEYLLAACAGLLEKLERFLRVRQLAAQRLTFSFYHLQHSATEFSLGTLAAGRSAKRWLTLLGIRFETVTLPAPVIAIRLVATDGQPLVAETAGLAFDDGARRNAPIAPLVERLAARIGEHAVHGVDTVAEHRPDYAWRRPPPLGSATQCCASDAHNPQLPALLDDMKRTERLLLRRPLWMLETPEALACRDDRPCYRGPLLLASGPERIETGWWDAHGVARDYYVAKTGEGVWLWIFRERGTGGWYLHGKFG